MRASLVENKLMDKDLSKSMFLTFSLGKDEFGLEILKVKEILGLLNNITTVPRMPDFIRGIINLRGSVIPVVDLRCKLEMERVDDTGETCIIVIEINNAQMGVIVDKVAEVIEIDTNKIETAPSFGIDIDTDFIHGIGKASDRVIILLDVEKALSSNDLTVIADIEQTSVTN